MRLGSKLHGTFLLHLIIMNQNWFVIRIYNHIFWARGRAVKSAVQIHRTLVSNPKVLGSNPTRGTLGKVSENQFLGPTNAM